MHKIDNSRENIIQMIKDLFIIPRNLMNKWSLITHQTAQVRLAYPGQHLASIVTGIPGTGTAARGDDLIDGTEVKSCSRADPLGICKNCSARVMRQFDICPSCNSTDIEIKEDSHWIFSIQSKKELELLISLPRMLLILFDRDEEKYIRIRIWQIDPKTEYVKLFFEDYFYKNYSAKAKKGDTKIAPCNLHPLKYDFFMMSPVLIFHATVNENDVSIKFLDLNNRESELMPSRLIKATEWSVLKANFPSISFSEFKEKNQFLTIEQKSLLKMRRKRIKSANIAHTRQSKRLK